MKTSTISVIIGVVVVALVGVVTYTTRTTPYVPPQATSVTPDTGVAQNTPVVVDPAVSTDPSPITDTPPEPTTTTTPQKPTVKDGITMSQIAEHNTRDSCWSAVNGSVYDLTSWIPNHPGGERRILSMCGVDGSDAYNGEHGSSKKTANILSGFKLGTLIQ